MNGKKKDNQLRAEQSQNKGTKQRSATVQQVGNKKKRGSGVNKVEAIHLRPSNKR